MKEGVLLKKTTIEQVIKCGKEQEWEKYLAAKYLADLLEKKARKLSENLQRQTPKTSRAKKEGELQGDVAEMLIYTILLGETLELDVDQVILERLGKEKILMGQKVAGKSIEDKLTESRVKVAVQPCCDVNAVEHLKKTIQSFVVLDDIKKFISNETKKVLERECPDGKLLIWGTLANKSLKQWEKLSSGDIVLFYEGKAAGYRFKYQAQIVHTVQNADLARFLWGEDDNGATWECVYFLKNLVTIDIERSTYNKLLGYDEKNPIQGFHVHNREKSMLLYRELKI